MKNPAMRMATVVDPTTSRSKVPLNTLVKKLDFLTGIVCGSCGSAYFKERRVEKLSLEQSITLLALARVCDLSAVLEDVSRALCAMGLMAALVWSLSARRERMANDIFHSYLSSVVVKQRGESKWSLQ